jgi:hypothetical protein
LATKASGGRFRPKPHAYENSLTAEGEPDGAEYLSARLVRAAYRVRKCPVDIFARSRLLKIKSIRRRSDVKQNPGDTNPKPKTQAKEPQKFFRFFYALFQKTNQKSMSKTSHSDIPFYKGGQEDVVTLHFTSHKN